MRLFAFLAVPFLACALAAQSAAPANTLAQSQSDLTHALLGDWTGVLEYRDYSEPATSTKRVQLPTWLGIHAQPESLRFHYVYDDGPTKTVESSSIVVIDAAARTYKVTDTDHTVESYTITGLDRLKQGRGWSSPAQAKTTTSPPRSASPSSFVAICSRGWKKRAPRALPTLLSFATATPSRVRLLQASQKKQRPEPSPGPSSNNKLYCTSPASRCDSRK